MKVNLVGISVEYAHGILSLTNHKANLSDGFDTVVREVHRETLRVDPYIVQDSRFEKVPGKDLCSWRLIPRGRTSVIILPGEFISGKEEIELIEKIIPDSGLQEEILEADPEDEEPFVVLVDGNSYQRETIETLPGQENVFVMFAPYRATKTLPIPEAKRFVQRGALQGHEPMQRFARVRSY
ncbi:MAG: hypothetical protein HYR97_07025 [Candidatus Melainabacteria bacterium]|nr:hypothetical protein [Candidatus Melainabacteria bacterium]